MSETEENTAAANGRQGNPTQPKQEPHTLDNALDVLRSWSWLYESLWFADGDTDARVAAGAAEGRNRQCSIGWHEECSDRSGINHSGDCSCPCHKAEWEKVGRLMRWMDECLSHLQETGGGGVHPEGRGVGAP